MFFTHVCVEVMYPGPVYEVLECASHFSLSISVFITVTCTIERHQVTTAATAIAKGHLTLKTTSRVFCTFAQFNLIPSVWQPWHRFIR